MVELPPANREALRPLFADYPYLQGLVYGALSGAFGQAFADQRECPTVGMIGIHDFVFFAGDAATPTANAMLQSCAPGAWLIGQDATWHKRFGEQWTQLKQKERFAFQAPTVWNRERLAAWQHELPLGCTLKPITEAAATRFAQLSASLVDFDAQGQPTMAHSVGFGVEQEGQFIAGCAGAPAGGMRA